MVFYTNQVVYPNYSIYLHLILVLLDPVLFANLDSLATLLMYFHLLMARLSNNFLNSYLALIYLPIVVLIPLCVSVITMMDLHHSFSHYLFDLFLILLLHMLLVIHHTFLLSFFYPISSLLHLLLFSLLYIMLKILLPIM